MFLRVVIFLLQLQIFNLVSLIIDRLGEKIVPCVEKILAFLPRVSHLVLHLISCLFHFVEIKVVSLLISLYFRISTLIECSSYVRPRMFYVLLSHCTENLFGLKKSSAKKHCSVCISAHCFSLPTFW